MQRKWYVFAHPETGMVEREDLIHALLDAAAILDRIGGVLSVVQERLPTGAPGEMRSVAVAIEWKDRTDAKAQPEQQVQVVAPPEPPAETEPPPGEESAALMEEPADALDRSTDSIGDGLDPSTLEDEDLSSVPEGIR